jgi:pyruvate,water dikinase
MTPGTPTATVAGMDFIVDFRAPEGSDKAVVGGKGANLGLLTRAGFPVPQGFCVSTAAYRAFLDRAGLSAEIGSLLDGVDYGDSDDLEARTAKIRGLILQTPVPSAISDAIHDAYTGIGADAYVAVRSSGTAEDLAEASFAGLHDTLLDIRGTDALVDAVKQCWASLWTARATSYRQNNGFDHSEALLSVVVQRMIAADVSGVLFTGNPLSTATNELMINASYGLGEAVVQGILTPDTYVVLADDCHVRDRVLGGKEVRIDRDPDAAHGTVTAPTPDADRARFSLTDAQASELARLGLEVQEYYEGFPQDIEWALEGGTFHLLQSRPITGVEFSWDADCEDWQTFDEPDGVVWTRSLADENWTGAITPLMYSWRAPSWVAGHEPATQLWGFPELQRQRFWKFHKACAYFNSNLERGVITHTVPPAFRAALGGANIPATWRDEVNATPFSWAGYLKMYARVEALRPQLYKGYTILNGKWRTKFSTEGKGLDDAARRGLSDRALMRYVDKQIAMEDEYNYDLWTWFFMNARDVMTLLGVLLAKWYDPEDATAFQALLTGVPEKSETMKANHRLWEMSELIRNSPSLRETFEGNPGAAFFTACAGTPDGDRFLEHYREFIELYGQRGQPDRDIYFPRRVEDPGIDYTALAAMLSTAESVDPDIKERENNAKREAFAEQVIEKIRRSPLGGIKVEIFKLVYDWSIRFVIARDNERNFLDHCTLSIRLGFMEIGRRLTERGVFESEDDLWYVTRKELYALLEGAPLTELQRAKITARRRDHHRALARESVTPKYIVNNRGVDLDAVEDLGDGVLRGTGTARGTVTATARVVRQLKDVGRVREGEILVVNATDPGWTPVFHIISGIVLETGGILAHGSCLAREYGLPAVQIADAMRLIPDGATITLNGDAGTVSILEEAAE